MKQITELTEIEILALTDERLSNMVKYKMAESGIKILETPEVPEYAVMPPKDWTLYKVEGIDKMFINKDDADKVSKLLRDIKESNALANNEYIGYEAITQHAKLFTSDHYAFPGFAEVKETPLYREKTINGVKDIIQKNKELKAGYETAVKEYKEADTASADIKAVIYGTYSDVVKKYDNMEDMKYQYERYVKLADGNEATAMKFLKNAYTIDTQTEYYVQGLEMPVIDMVPAE